MFGYYIESRKVSHCESSKPVTYAWELNWPENGGHEYIYIYIIGM